MHGDAMTHPLTPCPQNTNEPQHMLFLGSGKYPRENTYKDLVNRHGGHANASTSMDLTVYHFDVAAPEHYPAVLDVFAQFFIGLCVRVVGRVVHCAWVMVYEGGCKDAGRY